MSLLSAFHSARARGHPNLRRLSNNALEQKPSFPLLKRTKTKPPVLFQLEQHLPTRRQIGITTNDRVDIRRAGDYRVTEFVRIRNIDDAEQVNVIIIQNSVTVAEGRVFSSATDTSIVERSRMIVCAANDIIELNASHTEGGPEHIINLCFYSAPAIC
jgi:hypothetical protein